MTSGIVPEFSLLVTNLYAPPGTRMIFHNATAPLGWTIDATLTDHTVQIIGAGAGSSGGVNGYSAEFNGTWTSDAHAVTVAEMPSHNHGLNDPGHGHSISDPGHNHSYTAIMGGSIQAGTTIAVFSNGVVGGSTSVSGVGIGINAAASNTSVAFNGSNGGHTHTKTFNSKFIQCSVAQKS